MIKKDIAFKLFDAKKTPASPEIKALKLKQGTRYSYFSLWNKLRKARGLLDESETGSETVKESETTEGPETIGSYEESPKVEKIEKPEVKGEAESEGDTDDMIEDRGGDGTEESEKEKLNILGEEETEGVISEKVVGFGIHVGVHLSLKTLALYQIAYSIDSDLKLGEFIDRCVADWFVVRGQDLGMVKLRR